MAALDTINSDPRTFALRAPPLQAPSAKDILGQLEFFFGKPAQPEKLTDFNDHHAATYHFPDAYLGKNIFLRDTLSNLILKSPQTWHTSVAMPYVQIEGVTVQWDEMHFDVRLLQRVPYEGATHPAIRRLAAWPPPSRLSLVLRPPPPPSFLYDEHTSVSSALPVFARGRAPPNHE